MKGWLLSRQKYVKVYSFSGADTHDMFDFIKPLLNKNPDEIILHVGTNNLQCMLSPEQIVDEILKLRMIMVSFGIQCTISTLVKRDDGYWDKGAEVNRLTTVVWNHIILTVVSYTSTQPDLQVISIHT